jgi:mannitol 2-dehydrogenase
MEEAGTTLLPVPGIAVPAYKDKLIDRFSNRNIGDTILRLCEDGSKKLPNFCMKPLAAVIKQGGVGDAITLGLAGWARFLSGTDEAGAKIPIQDPAGSGLLPLAKNALTEPRKFLEVAGMNGLDENEMNALAGRFRTRLEALYKDGAKKVLHDFCAAHAN